MNADNPIPKGTIVTYCRTGYEVPPEGWAFYSLYAYHPYEDMGDNPYQPEASNLVMLIKL